MQRRNHTWPGLAVALVVAVPLAIVWAAIGLWLFSLVEDRLFPSPGYAYEVLQITRDGTPVIETIVHSSRGAPEGEFRSLDGQVVNHKREDLLNSAYLIVPTKSNTFLPSLVTWKERVAGISDCQPHGNDWYLVRPAGALGPGYFVGFNEATKLIVGYIGKAGFQPGPLSRDEWFDLPRRPLSYPGGIAVCSPDMAFAARPFNYYQDLVRNNFVEDGAEPWEVFLVDGDRLCEIDLRTRKVRAVHEAPGPLSISFLYQPPAPNAEKNVPFLTFLAVRSPDRVFIIDPKTDAAREFVLPENLRDRPLSAYLVPGESLLVSTTMGVIGRTPPLELSWLSPDGRVTRYESVKLASAVRPQMSQAAWVAGGIMPMPLAWLYLIGSEFSIEPSLAQEGLSYTASVSNTIWQVWHVAAVVAALGAVMAWLAYRLQRKYHRPATAAWCGFVFLFGPAGLLAYWIEHRPVKLETCPQCKATVPRDREACAACESVFLPPLRLGTEIFA